MDLGVVWIAWTSNVNSVDISREWAVIELDEFANIDYFNGDRTEKYIPVSIF